MLKLTRQDAKRLAITKQYLSNIPEYTSSSNISSDVSSKVDSNEILNLVRNLGCVQLDPIRAVEKTHLLVLWSRLGVFDPKELNKLRFDTKELFEYWAHAASIVLTEEYPIHAWKMNRYKSDTPERQKIDQWLSRVSNRHALEKHIKERLKKDGPLMSREIEDDSSGDEYNHRWWSGRYVPNVLQAMWSAGDITVARRQGLQKKWALSEDFFPEWTPKETWEENEVVRYSVQKSLRALGVATLKQIKQHYTRGRYPNVNKVLKELIKEGKIIEVEVFDEGSAMKGPWYIHAEDLPLLEQLQTNRNFWKPRTTLLSPFDNLICDRERTELLFDFFYRIEIYVPEKKRQYGYYVLPILHEDNLIGRIDANMDRKAEILNINNVYKEDSAPDDVETLGSIKKSVESLATFLNAKEINIGTVPTKWKKLKK